MSFSVKTRILLLGMLPLLIALWFMGLAIVKDFQLMRSLKDIEPATYLNAHIAAYIHEVQKERGATGVFLSSEGKNFQAQLAQQRHLTDKTWTLLDKFISTQDVTDNSSFIEKLNQAVGLAREISALRQKVDSLSISIKDALGQYTHHNSQWLGLIQDTAALTDNVDVSQMRLAYASFAKGKESAGVERAIITSVFGKDILSSEALKKLTHLIAEQHTYMNFFKAMARPEQLQFYQQKTSGSVNQDVQSLRDKVMQKIDNLDRNVLVFQLSQAVGFGGAIHNFKNFVLRGKEKYFNHFLTDYKTIEHTITELEQLKNLSSADKKALADIKSVFEQYNTVINHVKHLHMEGSSIVEIDTMVKINDSPAVAGLKELVKGSSLGRFGVTASDSFQIYTRKINALKSVEDFLLHDMEITGHQLSEQVQTHFYVLLAITLLVVVVVLAGIFYVVNGITSPLGKAINFAQTIARNDLSQKLDINQKDEVGVLAQALNNMSDNLVQMVSQLANSSSTLNNYSQQMKQSSEDVSQSMDKQTHKTTETLQVAQGVVSDAERVAEMSTEAAHSAAKAGQTASEGGVVVTNAITSIREIADIVNHSASSVEELNKLGENISSIISVIEGIAEQTNLLALNAAIEAARAGEQGRGFAVVADEVRQLAQRTAEATHEVSESIKSIQENTQLVSQQMQTGTERAAHSVEQAGQASNALNEIVNQSKSVADMIDSIAQASTGQVGEIGKISGNIQVIDELASQSMNAIEQAAKIAEDLQGSAQSLDEQISLFKLT